MNLAPTVSKCSGKGCTKHHGCYRFTSEEIAQQARHEYTQEKNGDCMGYYPLYWNNPVRVAPPVVVKGKRR